MKQLFLSLNRQYDKVQEPNRMLIMLALIVPGIVLATMNSATLVVIGFAWLLSLLALRASFIHKWLK